METKPDDKTSHPSRRAFLTAWGSALGFVATAATIVYFLWSMNIDAYKTRIEDLNSRLAEQKNYEDRYHDEAVTRQKAETTAASAEAKAADLTKELQALRACRWQEQYETTKADLVAARESLRLLEAQHESMRKSFAEEKTDLLAQVARASAGSETRPVSIPAYDALMNEHMKLKRTHADLLAAHAECSDQRKRLTDQLTVANSQITDLKKLVAATPPPAPENKDITKAKLEALIASVQGLDDANRVQVITHGLKSITSKFHVGYMLAMMNGMSFDSNKEEVVKAAAPYLIYPIDPQNMQVLIRAFSFGSNRSDALNALNEAQLKSGVK